MNTVKQWFSDMWVRITLVGVGLIAILAWLLSLKSEKVDALQTQLDTANTQKKVDAVEAQVKQDMNNAAVDQKQIDQQQQQVNQIEQKRAELPKQPDLTPDQVETYWKNN